MFDDRDRRLIERWLPIGELGIESIRERTPMTPFPAPNRLHVWWARRPLVASRAAVLASLLPADADRGRFLRVLGIHGDPVAAKARIARANRTGERLGAGAYGYPRAFGYTPDDAERSWLADHAVVGAAVLDPTAGGGSVPFEAARLGLATLANDLNPVAALIEEATVTWPAQHGHAVKHVVEALGAELIGIVRERLAGVFPAEPGEDTRPDGYLWARTVGCPYCGGRVPLAPNWRLAPDGTGVRLEPLAGGGPGRVCRFRIVREAREQSAGTVARGAGACPWPDCGRVIAGEEIKAQAQAGRMGEQLFAVVYKERVTAETKTGRRREKWVRRYRAPRPEDDNAAEVEARLAEKLPEWEAYDLVPGERIPDGTKTAEPLRYGMPRWRDLFSPRQLLCHGTGVEVFRELLDADRTAGALTPLREAAYGYLALSLDKTRDYNSRMTRWHVGREVMVNTFDRHDFSFKWSYAEMAPLIAGLGYDWAIRQTAKCIGELVALVRPDADAGPGGLFEQDDTRRPPVTITCKSGDNLDHLADGSIDAVIMDPPYYDNVMYAELEEFSRHWPLTRGAPRPQPQQPRRGRRQSDLFEAEADPYAVTPEDVLDVARREVKRWRLEQLTHRKANADLDPPTAFFVLAWDAFEAPVFAYDEALRLARAVGVDLDGEVVGRLAEKRGSELRLWDSARRAAAGALGPADGSRGMIDTVHHAAHAARGGTLNDARELLDEALGAREAAFLTALEAVLEVLPVTRRWTSIDLPGEAAPAGDDFAVLYDLVRLAYSDRIDEPEQLRLKLWQEDAA